MFARSITMITTMEQLNCIDSSLFFLNFYFRFGVLSDLMRRIFWRLHFSFANLKILRNLKIWNDFLHVVYVVWSLDSSWVFFNFNFRFGDLSDVKRLICWFLHFSFANLNTLAHFENLERCCHAWFGFRKFKISNNIQIY